MRRWGGEWIQPWPWAAHGCGWQLCGNHEAPWGEFISSKCSVPMESCGSSVTAEAIREAPAVLRKPRSRLPWRCLSLESQAGGGELSLLSFLQLSPQISPLIEQQAHLRGVFAQPSGAGVAALKDEGALVGHRPEGLSWSTDAFRGRKLPSLHPGVGIHPSSVLLHPVLLRPSAGAVPPRCARCPGHRLGPTAPGAGPHSGRGAPVPWGGHRLSVKTGTLGLGSRA